MSKEALESRKEPEFLLETYNENTCKWTSSLTFIVKSNFQEVAYQFTVRNFQPRIF